MMLTANGNVRRPVQNEMRALVEQWLEPIQGPAIAYFTIPKHNYERASVLYPVYLRNSYTHRKFVKGLGGLLAHDGRAARAYVQLPSRTDIDFPYDSDYHGGFLNWGQLPNDDLRALLHRFAKRNNLTLDSMQYYTLRFRNGGVNETNVRNVPPTDAYISYVIIARFRFPTLAEFASRAVPKRATGPRLRDAGYPKDIIQQIKRQRGNR